MVIALSLPTLALSRDELDLVEFHLDRLARFENRNALKAAYYEGRQRVKHLGISIPPSMRDLEVVVGWPGTAVDVLEERLDWLGWTSDAEGDPFGLDEVYRDNGLDVDSGLGHLDALIYGTGFVVVGSGFEGEPQPLVTVESPRTTTGEWDARLRRLSSALSVNSVEHGKATDVTLYLPDQNVRIGRSPSGLWSIADRDEHGLGRVTAAVLPNRPRASRVEGRSEITRAIRSATDDAVRALLGMAVHREFYQAPQRYALNVGEDSFEDADGRVKTGWEAIMGRMLAIGPNEDGEEITVGQFPSSDPRPYFEQVKGHAQLVSAEASIPASYLGFVSDNPASADAIRASEARLVKRAERRQTVFGRTWREVAALALLVRDGKGSLPDNFGTIGSRWRDAATPTRAAAADEVVKYVAANVLPADSEVTYARMGLSPQEIRTLKAEQRRAAARAAAAGLAQRAAQVRAEQTAPADESAAPAATPEAEAA